MTAADRSEHQRSLRRAVERQAATTSTFGAWLAQQTGRQDPVGSLARDWAGCTVCADRTERRYSVSGVRAELDDHGAIPEAYDALERAAREWRAATGREQP